MQSESASGPPGVTLSSQTAACAIWEPWAYLSALATLYLLSHLRAPAASSTQASGVRFPSAWAPPARLSCERGPRAQPPPDRGREPSAAKWARGPFLGMEGFWVPKNMFSDRSRNSLPMSSSVLLARLACVPHPLPSHCGSEDGPALRSGNADRRTGCFLFPWSCPWQLLPRIPSNYPPAFPDCPVHIRHMPLPIRRLYLGNLRVAWFLPIHAPGFVDDCGRTPHGLPPPGTGTLERATRTPPRCPPDSQCQSGLVRSRRSPATLAMRNTIVPEVF